MTTRGVTKTGQRTVALPTDRVVWDDLRFFLAAAEYGSLRAAAQAMGTTVTTMGRHIENLEYAIGETLVLRQRQGVQLTPLGQAMVPDIQELASLVDRLGDKILAQGDLPAGRVRLAVTEGLLTYWVGPRLIPLQRRYPKVTIETISTMSLTEVTRSHADVAIQLQRPTDPDRVVSRLGKIHLSLFMSEEYREQYGTPETLKDLRRHKLILQTADPVDTEAFLRLFQLPDVQGTVPFTANTSSIVYMLTAKGAGIGLLPNYANALGADLIPVDLGVRHDYDIWLSYDRTARRSKVKAMVIDWLKDCFDPDRFPWFADGYEAPDALLRLPREDWAVNMLPRIRLSPRSDP